MESHSVESHKSPPVQIDLQNIHISDSTKSTKLKKLHIFIPCSDIQHRFAAEQKNFKAVVIPVPMAIGISDKVHTECQMFWD